MMRALISPEAGSLALERIVAHAQEDLCLSLRQLDPDAALLSPELKDMGLERWGDLISDVSARGVRIWILLADQDPLFASNAHRRAWRQASALGDVVGRDAQILCAPHGQTAGRLWQFRMRKAIRSAQDKLRKEDPTVLTPLQRQMIQARPSLRPARLNQCLAIADGSACLIGNLEVAPHPTGSSVALADTDFAGALHAHFADCWNDACAVATGALAQQAAPLDLPRRRQAPTGLRLLRSYSIARPGMARLGPQPAACDHEVALLRLIREAKQSIFIQTRAMHHTPLVDALITAAGQQPDLQLVLMLPIVPDSPQHEGPAQAAQWHAVAGLRTGFGPRMTALTLAEGQTGGLMLVDGRVTVVGSANFSARSMSWDSEASAEIRDPAFALATQEALATLWLSGGDPALAATWRQEATKDGTVLKLYPDTAVGSAVPRPGSLPPQWL